MIYRANEDRLVQNGKSKDNFISSKSAQLVGTQIGQYAIVPPFHIGFGYFQAKSMWGCIIRARHVYLARLPENGQGLPIHEFFVQRFGFVFKGNALGM